MFDNNQCGLPSPHTNIRNTWPDMAATAHTHVIHFVQRWHNNFAEQAFQNRAVNASRVQKFK